MRLFSSVYRWQERLISLLAVSVYGTVNCINCSEYCDISKYNDISSYFPVSICVPKTNDNITIYRAEKLKDEVMFYLKTHLEHIIYNSLESDEQIMNSLDEVLCFEPEDSILDMMEINININKSTKSMDNSNNSKSGEDIFEYIETESSVTQEQNKNFQLNDEQRQIIKDLFKENLQIPVAKELTKLIICKFIFRDRFLNTLSAVINDKLDKIDNLFHKYCSLKNINCVNNVDNEDVLSEFICYMMNNFGNNNSYFDQLYCINNNQIKDKHTTIKKDIVQQCIDKLRACNKLFILNTDKHQAFTVFNNSNISIGAVGLNFSDTTDKDALDQNVQVNFAYKKYNNKDEIQCKNIYIPMKRVLFHELLHVFEEIYTNNNKHSPDRVAKILKKISLKNITDGCFSNSFHELLCIDGIIDKNDLLFVSMLSENAYGANIRYDALNDEQKYLFDIIQVQRKQGDTENTGSSHDSESEVNDADINKDDCNSLRHFRITHGSTYNQLSRMYKSFSKSEVERIVRAGGIYDVRYEAHDNVENNINGDV